MIKILEGFNFLYACAFIVGIVCWFFVGNEISNRGYYAQPYPNEGIVCVGFVGAAAIESLINFVAMVLVAIVSGLWLLTSGSLLSGILITLVGIIFLTPVLLLFFYVVSALNKRLKQRALRALDSQ